MAMQLYWDDAEDIGYALAQKFPGKNPLEVRFTDLHRIIVELPGFDDDPWHLRKESLRPFKWLGMRSSKTTIR